MPDTHSHPTPATLAYLLLRAATLARRIIHREETQDAADYDAASCLLTALAHALQVGAVTPDQLAELSPMTPRPWDLLRELADQLEAAELSLEDAQDGLSVETRPAGPYALGGYEPLLGELPCRGHLWLQRRVGRTLVLVPAVRAVR